MTDFFQSMRTLKKESKAELNWTIAMGVVSVLSGLLALVFTGLTSLFTAIAIGWFYIFSGIALIIVAFRMRKVGGFWSPFIFGILFVIGGICIVSRPLINMEILTLLIAMMMLVTGISKLVSCFIEKFKNKGMLFFSAVISIICGLMILFSWPFSGFWVLGTLVGVDLIFWGSAMISFASMAKKALV